MGRKEAVTKTRPWETLLEWQSKELQKFAPSKAIRTLTKMITIKFFSKVWKLIKYLQKAKKCLFKKNNWILLRTVSFVTFKLTLFPSLSFQFYVSLGNQQPCNHRKGQIRFGVPHKVPPHSTVIIWPVWQLLRIIPFYGLTFIWLDSGVTQWRKPYPEGRGGGYQK